MKTSKSITYNNPQVLGGFVFFPANLQNALIYDNELGLVALINLHRQVVVLQEDLPKEVMKSIEYSTIHGLRDTCFDCKGFGVRFIDFRKARNFIALNATEIPTHVISSNQTVWGS